MAFPNVLNSKYVLGNPVRDDISMLDSPDKRYALRTHKGLNILIVGGSLGAKALNEVVPLSLAKLTNIAHITHQIGRDNIENVQQLYHSVGIHNVEVVNFIDDMATQYANCDLIICRSGASTIAEITTVGIASILVPYPHAVDDHQTQNAKLLVDSNAAILIKQSTLTPESLHHILSNITREKCTTMAIKSHGFSITNSAQNIATNIESFIS